jgi:prepilin-type N-terminal cleavage/methylation domain-containing protein
LFSLILKPTSSKGRGSCLPRHLPTEPTYPIMNNRDSQKGFSILEIIVAMLVLAIFTALAINSFSSARKYNADDQAQILVDILNEARQGALNQRRTFRVEINRTINEITLIKENEPGDVTDDAIVKSIPFKSFVKIGEVPSNIAAHPTATSPIPVLNYVTSNYPLSNGHEKITLRFARNGLVLDPGNDNIGTGSLMRGATIYIFSNKEGTNTPQIIRAVTVLQTTGDTAILKCSFDAGGRCGNWTK